ncbi:M28 family peptidase [Halococcus salsus]|uniref:M28 family peptidase n=1 Tax=Halococcus salsus TaxID=2162894 RepID=UPI001358EE4D|nr:M28 family metallopeptidase [Halococcus salsus]
MAPDDIDATLGAAWHDDSPWDLLTRLCAFDDRLGGGPGERHAADLVADELDSLSLDPRIEPFGMQRWTRGHTAFSVHPSDERSREFEAVALPYSPAADLRAPLVDVGHGTPAEVEAAAVEGAIAVASTDSPAGERHTHRMEKLGHAVAAGARGFVFHNHVRGQLPPTGALQFGHEAPIPGVGVSHETGAWLREYAAEDEEASLRVDATTDDGESRNVVAKLGPESDAEVLVLAHYDSHDVGEGALDNGCGVAVALAATRLLTEFDLDSQVQVAAVGCEELGLLGSAALADSLDLDRVKAVVNVDGAGRFRNLRALTHTSEAMTAVAERVAEESGQPIATAEGPHPYSDHWPFLRRGIPALQLHSRTPGGGGEWDRGFTHTRADTRDKVDPRNLRTHAMLTALLVRDLSTTDPDRVDTDALRETLREAGAEPGMRAAEVWPPDWD